MTNEELNAWERHPIVLTILTSKEFGEWLHRRDKNKEKQLTSDVVEVVRCKDCKFYPGGYFSDDRIMIETYMHCPNFKDDGFCSFGRRKEE